jgi:formylglycine-generating enzyme required for sulfatase activity
LPGWFFKTDERLEAARAALRALGLDERDFEGARHLDTLAATIEERRQSERLASEHLERAIVAMRGETERLLAAAPAAALEGREGVFFEILRSRRAEKLLEERRLFLHARQNAFLRAAETVERIRLGASVALGSPREALADELEVEKLRLVALACPKQPEWIAIPAGVWLVGATAGDREARPDEGPETVVRLSAFEIAREASEVMHFSGIDPTTLPTELEWEVAVRYFGLVPTGVEWCRDEWEPALYVRAASELDPVGRGDSQWRVARGPRPTQRTRLAASEALRVRFRVVRRSAGRGDE